jgi:hypothetical protein
MKEYNLVIYDYDGDIKATFPLESTTYDEFFGRLHVEHDGGLQMFRLDRYSYAVEER